MVRRESANVVEKQIQTLVQASRPVASAILDNAASCKTSPAASAGLKPLLASTDEVFPPPHWLPQPNFAGLVADGGRLEIRNLVTRLRAGCKTTPVFSLPPGPESARQLSSASGVEVTSVCPGSFRVYPPHQRLLRTVEAGNPGPRRCSQNGFVQAIIPGGRSCIPGERPRGRTAIDKVMQQSGSGGSVCPPSCTGGRLNDDSD